MTSTVEILEKTLEIHQNHKWVQGSYALQPNEDHTDLIESNVRSGNPTHLCLEGAFMRAAYQLGLHVDPMLLTLSDQEVLEAYEVLVSKVWGKSLTRFNDWDCKDKCDATKVIKGAIKDAKRKASQVSDSS